MNDYNPYRPTSKKFGPDFATSTSNAELQKRVLPRSFWILWGGYTCLSLSALVVILSLLRSSREAVSFLGLPVLGLWLAPFVCARAKLCEKYQHRCVASNGTKIFFACLGVCFGLGYAVLGMSFLLYMFLSAYIDSRSFSSVLISFLLVGTISVVTYLKLIDLSARSPKLGSTNKTELEGGGDAS